MRKIIIGENKDDVKIATSLNNISYVYKNLKIYNLALENQKKAVEMKKRIF